MHIPCSCGRFFRDKEARRQHYFSSKVHQGDPKPPSRSPTVARPILLPLKIPMPPPKVPMLPTNLPSLPVAKKKATDNKFSIYAVGGKLVCNCGATLRNLDACVSHLQSHSQGSIGGEATITRTQLVVHALTGRYFECRCGATFHTQAARNQHIAQLHDTESHGHVCKCGATFWNLGFWHQHINKAVPEAEHGLDCLCGVNFRSELLRCFHILNPEFGWLHGLAEIPTKGVGMTGLTIAPVRSGKITDSSPRTTGLPLTQQQSILAPYSGISQSILENSTSGNGLPLLARLDYFAQSRKPEIVVRVPIDHRASRRPRPDATAMELKDYITEIIVSKKAIAAPPMQNGIAVRPPRTPTAGRGSGAASTTEGKPQPETTSSEPKDHDSLRRFAEVVERILADGAEYAKMSSATPTWCTWLDTPPVAKMTTSSMASTTASVQELNGAMVEDGGGSASTVDDVPEGGRLGCFTVEDYENEEEYHSWVTCCGWCGGDCPDEAKH